MKITIIDGTLQDYVNGDENGVISFSEPCTDDSIKMADKFLSYGKTVVIEPENRGE